MNIVVSSNSNCHAFKNINEEIFGFHLDRYNYNKRWYNPDLQPQENEECNFLMDIDSDVETDMDDNVEKKGKKKKNVTFNANCLVYQIVKMTDFIDKDNENDIWWTKQEMYTHKYNFASMLKKSKEVVTDIYGNLQPIDGKTMKEIIMKCIEEEQE